MSKEFVHTVFQEEDAGTITKNDASSIPLMANANTKETADSFTQYSLRVPGYSNNASTSNATLTISLEPYIHLF